MRGRKAKPIAGTPPNRLRELREARQMSIAELAKLVGYTPVSVGRHETGERQLKSYQLEMYAKALDCGPADIVAGGNQISDRERRLLELYRQLPKSQQDALLGLGSALAEPPLDFLPPHDERTGKKKA